MTCQTLNVKRARLKFRNTSVCMKSRDGFIWLELKPQQNFTDQDGDKIRGVIRHAQEFGFFIFRDSGSMRMLVRTRDQVLWRTIPGISAEEARAPSFENMVARCLAFKRRSLIPLVDLDAVTCSGTYAKMWEENTQCMMGCIAYDSTRKACADLERIISAFESTNGSSTGARSRKKTEYAAARQRRDHGHYNCSIIFGARHDHGPSCGTCHRSCSEEAGRVLARLIRGILLNRFAYRMTARRARLAGAGSWKERVAEFFGASVAIDPLVFVPSKMHSKSILLAEAELAFFVSFPSEHEARSINFGIGPTPTFVHGMTEEMDKTDITIQYNENADDHAK